MQVRAARRNFPDRPATVRSATASKSNDRTAGRPGSCKRRVSHRNKFVRIAAVTVGDLKVDAIAIDELLAIWRKRGGLGCSISQSSRRSPQDGYRPERAVE